MTIIECFDHYKNKLSVIKTSDNCVFSKTDLRAIRVYVFLKMTVWLLDYFDFKTTLFTKIMPDFGEIANFGRSFE